MLSGGHKLGLGLVAVAFILFALASAFVLPRRNPDFPGKRLPLFLTLSFALFIAMLAAVEVFGKEKKEQPKGAEAAPAAATKGGEATTVKVEESEWKVALSKTLRPGTYTFEDRNVGKVSHNLSIAGPGVTKTSATIAGGKTTTLESVTLKAGTYHFFCAVPGHKGLGMDLAVTVS